MKLTALMLLSALPAAAQTTPSPASSAKSPVHAVHRTAASSTAATASGACVKEPDFSSKIPALPAGTPCAKHLYTITTVPSVKLDYVSPLEGPAFRESLGIESTSFSLDYVDTKVGTGEPAAGKKWYSIHYTGYLTDGTKFDSSVDRGEPLAVPYGQHKVIPGWDTGFAGMHVGGKRRLYIPYQLAYGPNGKPPTIPAKSELIFDVELVSASDTEPEHKTPPAAANRPRPLNLGPPNAPINGQPGSAPAPGATPKPSTPGSNPPSGTTPPASTTPPVGDPTKPTAAPPATTTPPPASTPPPAKP